MMQTIIVILVVAGTVGWAVYRLVRVLRGSGGCACGCTGCPKACGKGECHCAERKNCGNCTIK